MVACMAVANGGVAGMSLGRAKLGRPDQLGMMRKTRCCCCRHDVLYQH